MDLNTVLIVVGGALLALGLSSRIVKRLFLSSVLLATLVGVGVGPEGLGVVELSGGSAGHHVMEEVARITLAIALMGAGLQITRADLRENATRAGLLLTGGMVGMWVMTGLGAWLLLDLPFWAGFLLGAILTPTDPVVASALVTGPLAESNLPRRLRRTLQIEAGANDGLALPFVLLAAFMLTRPAGEALSDWALESLQQIGIALVAGAAIGYLAAWALELSLHHSDTEQANLLGVGVSIALLTAGLVGSLDASGVFAVFVAALVFSTRLEHDIREQVEEVQEAVVKFFVLPAFILFGAILPWSDWSALGVPGILFAAWALLVRRPPVVPLVLAPSRTAKREVLFLGWFGPLGVAAIFYATFVAQYDIPQYDRIFAAATLAICASVLAHAITATPAVRAFAGRSPAHTLAHPLSAEAERAP